MRVISLGWGVQSFTLAAMAALGDIPPVDAAIHQPRRTSAAPRMRLPRGGRRGWWIAACGW